MKKNKRSNAERRERARLARRGIGEASLTAYHGQKYKTPALTPLYLHIEMAIHEADVVAENQLVDADVKAAFKQLILLASSGRLFGKEVGETRRAGYADFIAALIVSRLGEKKLEPIDNATWVGIFRTLLASLQHWGENGPRGYVDFVTAFVSKAGGSCRRATSEEALQLLKASAPVDVIDAGTRALPIPIPSK